MGDFGRKVLGYALDGMDQRFPNSTVAAIAAYDELDMASDFCKEHYVYGARHPRSKLINYIHDTVGPIKFSERFKLFKSFEDKIVDKKQQEAESRLLWSDFGLMPKDFDKKAYSDRIRRAQEIAEYLPKDTWTFLSIVENIEKSGMSDMRFDEMTDADWKRLAKFIK